MTQFIDWTAYLLKPLAGMLLRGISTLPINLWPTWPPPLPPPLAAALTASVMYCRNPRGSRTSFIRFSFSLQG